MNGKRKACSNFVSDNRDRKACTRLQTGATGFHQQCTHNGLIYNFLHRKGPVVLILGGEMGGFVHDVRDRC